MPSVPIRVNPRMPRPGFTEDGARYGPAHEVRLDPRLRQFDAEAALVVFGHRRPLHLVALVEEGDAEGEGDVVEDLRVLGPGDDRARAHDGGDVAVDEAGAGQVGQAHHRRHSVAALGVVIGRDLGLDDLHLGVDRQVVQGRHDVPAVHLALVDLLRAVIQAGGVAQADGVRGGEQAEGRMRADDAVLVEQRQLALHLQHALDHEHHVGTAGVILVEHQGAGMLQGPGQDALAVFGDLHAVAQHDGVLAHQVDAADVAVQVDADAGPVEARRHLFDVGRLAGAVIALDHHAAVVGEAGEDGQSRVPIKAVGAVEVGHMLRALAEGRHLHVAVDAEDLAHRDRRVGLVVEQGRAGLGRSLGSHGWFLTFQRVSVVQRPRD